MSELEQHISEIKNKLQVLQKRSVSQKKENELLQAALATMQDKEATIKEALEKAEQQNLILKASLNNLSPQDKKELLKKINGYLKTVESCISLMSK